MTSIKFLLIGVVSLFLINTSSIDPEFEKTVNSSIAKLFKDQEIEIKAIENVSNDEDSLLYLRSWNSIHYLQAGDSLVGFLVLAKAKSRFDIFDYMVILDENRKITHVKIMKYPGIKGGEIANRGWLKNFIGKDYSSLENDYSIDCISGATISSTSLTNAIKDILIGVNKMHEAGMI